PMIPFHIWLPEAHKIIAYSSIAHMNFVMIGMFSLNIQGIEGNILLMLNHGLVFSALFFMCWCFI
ncbi:unnamed protein product, partial [Sphagnum jensenii]